MSILSIDQQICEFFTNGGGALDGWGVVILACLSLLVTILCAGAVGYEREYHGHAAGLRTHLLVALGSALIMFLSIYGFGHAGLNQNSDGSWIWQRDPARLAAQVVSGVGFLGAGTIIRTGNDIKGLTTATTIWFVMAIGLAAGSGNYILCVIATILSLVALLGMRKLEKRINKHNPKLVIRVESAEKVVKTILEYGQTFGVSIRGLSADVVEVNNKKYTEYSANIVYADKGLLAVFVDELKGVINPVSIEIVVKR